MNPGALLQDLEKHPEVISEAIQTILRREKFPQPYEALKKLSRVDGSLRLADIHHFISSLDIDDQVKEELFRISPQNYIGILP